jgi:5-formyltetrahydrofolate cyclo-ligase
MVFESDVETELRRRAKLQLRKRMRALRNTIPSAALSERSSRIVAQVAACPAFIAATEIALFAPMLGRNEVDVRELDRIARRAGKDVTYPRLTSGPESAELEPRSEQCEPEPPAMVFRRAPLEELEDRGFGFAEPPEDAPLTIAHADLLIVVPALALDGKGHRIGYGAGFYDRTLAAAAPPATTLAVAYDFQIVAEVPADEWDRPVDWIATDARLFATAAHGL